MNWVTFEIRMRYGCGSFLLYILVVVFSFTFCRIKLLIWTDYYFPLKWLINFSAAGNWIRKPPIRILILVEFDHRTELKCECLISYNFIFFFFQLQQLLFLLFKNIFSKQTNKNRNSAILNCVESEERYLKNKPIKKLIKWINHIKNSYIFCV